MSLLSTADGSRRLTVERVRHVLKRRWLTVARLSELSPSLRLVTLSGDDLQDFTSLSFDDHVKLFFPAAEDNHDLSPPAARDFTPRRVDAHGGEIDIQFYLHGDGPAARWARQAQIGQRLELGGPKGSFLIPTQFDWFFMIGDETAWPAIFRRLAEGPAAPEMRVVLQLDVENQPVPWPVADHVRIQRVARTQGPQAFQEAVAGLGLPPGEGFVWAAGEARAMRAVHAHFMALGLPHTRIRAASYWRQGTPAVHEQHGA